jgi:hypothetical protein
MEFATTVFYLVISAIALQFAVVRMCAGHPAMWHRRAYFRLAAIAWSVMPIAKVCYIDLIVPPADGLGHEMIAREVADLITVGRYADAASYFAIGNNAYRSFLGLFYAITGVPEIVTYTINGALGFLGLLALLDVLCRHSNCSRLPLSAVFAVSLLPSGLIWTTANLKEGAILWGICMMLYLTVPPTPFQEHPRRMLSILGFVVVAFLRPHIAVVWLGAIGAGKTLETKRFSLFLATCMAALLGLVMISYLAPEMFASAMKDGVSTTLSDRYSTLSSNDRLNGEALTGSNPIPILSGLTLILFRPWPFEVNEISELLVGLEVWVLAILGFLNWKAIGARRLLLFQPVVVTNLVALLAFGFFFSYMYNMGLAVRQRLMCLPALLFLYLYPLLVRQRLGARAACSRPTQRRTLQGWPNSPRTRLTG